MAQIAAGRRIDTSTVQVKRRDNDEIVPASQYDIITMYSQQTKNNGILLNPGMNCVIAEGKGAAFGYIAQDVELYCDPSSCSVELSVDKFEYTGEPITPPVPKIIAPNGDDIWQTYQPKKILYPDEENAVIQKSYGLYTSYTVEYRNNVNAGTAYIDIKPSRTDKADARPKMLWFTITGIDAGTALSIEGFIDQLTYKGTAKITQNAVVKYGRTVLYAGIDYDQEYTYPKDVLGDVTYVISPKKNFTGNIKKTFSIVADLADVKIYGQDPANIINEQTKYEYDGKSIKPLLTVKAFDLTLKNNVNYTVEYDDAGISYPGAKTGRVIAKSAGFCIGTDREFKYKVVGSIQDCPNPLESIYEMANAKPDFDLNFHDKALVRGTDYTVTWPSDYTTVGRKSVQITGKGYYYGSMSFTYDVVDETFTILTNSSGAKKYIDTPSSGRLERASITYDGFSQDSITRVVVGSNVKTLAANMFKDFKKLESVDLHFATDIDVLEGCFEGCDNLKTVTLPN